MASQTLSEAIVQSGSTEIELSSNEKSMDTLVQKTQAIKEESKIMECNDDTADDIDLSAVEVATSILEQTFEMDEPELNFPANNDEAFRNLMGLCSSTAENLKKSIYDVLNSREKVVITEVDPTEDIQESLNKKMADFNEVVTGCMKTSTKSTGAQSINQSAEESNLSGQSQNVPERPMGNLGAVEDSDTALASECSRIEISHNEITANKDANVDTEKKVEMDPEISAIKKPASSIQTSDSIKEMLKNAISLEEEKLAKKQRNAASKKKGEKMMDQIMKSLGNGTAEEKLKVLCKKHVESLEEYRLVEPRLKQMERQIISQQREKEQLQAEHNRMILAKSRLEGLCREMQRQSKAVKEESLLRIKEEEEKRKEVANKFQSTLNDISSLIQENSKKNIQLREENTELATKLKSLVDNYEIWEKNMSKVVQQKELEAQLAKAKHAKVNLLLKQETEKFLCEKKSLLENLSELQKRCTVLTTNELQLRNELSDYVSKYDEFQNVLSNSSKVFNTFKSDMESTSKKIKKLEKETNVYKQKWESSNNALLDMINHKEKQDKEFSNAQQRILTLEKLCRALQAERNDLRNQINVLSDNSVSTTSVEVPSITAEPEVA